MGNKTHTSHANELAWATTSKFLRPAVPQVFFFFLCWQVTPTLLNLVDFGID